MMMEAWELGVGSTWVRGFDARVMHAAFDLPDTWKVVALMPMGYPADNARPSNWHFRRQPVEALYSTGPSLRCLAKTQAPMWNCVRTLSQLWAPCMG